MPAEGIHTAYFLQLMNRIADGTNGVHYGDDHPKRIPWSAESYHAEFFANTRRQLRSIRFIHSETQKPVTTDIPCLQNLINTLQGFELLWAKLEGMGFDNFATRTINQDPIENFFGNVRSHDFRSNKPTCYQFEAIYKSLLITNLTSKHSPGYNCEDDSGAFLLPQYNTLLSGTGYLPDEEDDEETNEVQDKEAVPLKSIEGTKINNSADIIKSVKRSLPALIICRECFHSFQIQSSQRQGSTCFMDQHILVKRHLGRMISSNISHKRIGKKLQRMIQRMVKFNFWTCNEHKPQVLKTFAEICVKKYIEDVATYINKVLRGRIIPRNKQLCTPIKLAQECYKKTIRKGT